MKACVNLDLTEDDVNVLVDIWDGANLEDEQPVARFLRPVTLALVIVRREIEAGYIVNVSQTDDPLCGIMDDYDTRSMH